MALKPSSARADADDDAALAWAARPEVARRLSSGAVAIDRQPPGNATGALRAAILVPAPPAALWAIMTSCERALRFVRELRSCTVDEASPDGRSDIRTHRLKYSILPTMSVAFRSDYVIDHTIRFRRLSGTIRNFQGSWQLAPQADGQATVVVYQLHIDVGFFVPGFIVRYALESDVPRLLGLLRDEAAQVHVAPPR